MNEQFRACVREVFSCDNTTNEWSGRWDVIGSTPAGERRQFSAWSEVANINHPVERDAAILKLWDMVKAEGVKPLSGILLG